MMQKNIMIDLSKAADRSNRTRADRSERLQMGSNLVAQTSTARRMSVKTFSAAVFVEW